MILLIDGDVLAYMACKSREPPVGGFDEDVDYTEEEDLKYLEESWDNFKKLVSGILDNNWTSDYLMAVKSAFNFRNILYPDYKMNRHKDVSKANKFVPMIRKLAVKHGMAIEAFNCEADDFLRIWAEQALAANEEYTVVSIDKDLYCIPGRHYNPKKEETRVINKLDATRHFYEQLLKGDSVDNIPGIVGIGPKKAEKALASCENETEMQEVVVSMYMDAYALLWHDMLLSNGKMLYLKKTYDDFFRIDTWPVVQEILPSFLEKHRQVHLLLRSGGAESPASAPESPKATPGAPTAPRLRPPPLHAVVPASGPLPATQPSSESPKRFKIPGKQNA